MCWPIKKYSRGQHYPKPALALDPFGIVLLDLITLEESNMLRLTLAFGVIASFLFIAGTLSLAFGVDGYSAASRTVSEIGKLGSAMEMPYKIMLVSVGFSVVAMSAGMYHLTKTTKSGIVISILVFSYGVCTIGLAIFPSPHKFHNVFGLSCIFGYFAPLVSAISPSNNFRKFRSLSWVFFIFILAFIFLSLSPLFAKDLYSLKYYGIVQRSVLYPFYAWLACLSFELLRFEKVRCVKTSDSSGKALKPTP